MAEQRGPRPIRAVLEDLRAGTDADLGVGVWLDGGDGSLELADAIGDVPLLAATTPSRLRHRLRRVMSERVPGAALLLPVPDARGGLLYLAREAARPFSVQDRALGRLYARQLARNLAVQEASVDASGWTRQLERVQRIGAQLTRLSSLEDVALALGVETRQIVRYEACWIYVVDDNETDLILAGHQGVPEGAPAAFVPAPATQMSIGHGIVGYVASRGEPLTVPDASTDPRALPLVGEPSAPTSLLLVPMRYEGRPRGVVVLAQSGHDAFEERELRLLQILADQAAVAVENARLLTGREQLVTELAALLEISRSGEAATDERALASSLAKRITRAAGVEHCALYRWHEDSTVMEPLGAFGRDATALDLVDHPSARHVLLGRRPALVHADDAELSPLEDAYLSRAGYQSVILAPLVAMGQVIGLAELAMSSRRRTFTAHELDFCLTMANHAGTALEHARLVEALRLAADVDQLTGVANHRYLQERLKQEVARAARTGIPLSVLMIDLDGFKQINDQYGHSQGDRVLRGVAHALKQHVRTNDIVARYGGDEFVVLMPDTPGADAAIVAERVAAGVRERSHPISDGVEVSVGASVGLSVYPTDATTPARLLAAADAGMYRAKRARRVARPGGPHESPVLETPRGRVAAGPGRTPAARPESVGAPSREGSRPS